MTETRTRLCTKLDIAVRRPPDVRVSKILAGQEADKTNLLLQALAEAIRANVDNNEVVRKTLQNLGETNDNEDSHRPSEHSRERKDPEKHDKHSARSERSAKSNDCEDSAPEKKASSKETSKVRHPLLVRKGIDEYSVSSPWKGSSRW